MKLWIVIIIIFCLYFAFDYIWMDDISLDKQENLSNYDSFDNVKEMHFLKMPITYLFLTTDKNKIRRIKWAFSLIENETEYIVKFKEADLNESPMIKIYRSHDVAYDENEKYVIEGEGGLNFIDNRIQNSIIIMYPAKEGDYYLFNSCADYPVTEVHELLHAFGFGHISSKKSIMNAIGGLQSCSEYKIDNETINCLKKIYSNNKMNGDCSKLNIYPYEISE